ncbi:Intracellular distribution of mitochondria, partial [Teratosphaeriaceae sp. CCFEE 6253]
TLKHFHESRKWFEVSLDICVEVAGQNSVNTATLYFQYAQALALDHDSKLAVGKMKESYSIFRELLGEENQNTREAGAWLETLVKSAVNQAQAASQASTLLGSSSNRRLFLRNGAPRGTRLGLGSRPQGSPAEAAQQVAEAQSEVRASGLDQRSLDELVKYVNGEKGQGQTTPKKKTANPKRRQQRAS